MEMNYMENILNDKNKILNKNVKEQNNQTIKEPNKRLLKALKEIEKIESGEIEAKHYKSFEEVLEDLD